MIISTKGQITIPEDLRKRFGFLPHTEVEFVEEGAKLVLKKKKGKAGGSIRKWLEERSGRADSGLSTKAIMALTRD